jgi:hypothetical protein
MESAGGFAMSVVSIEQRRRGYGLREVARAEWIKLSSLRSTYFTLLVVVLGSFGVTVLATVPARHHSHVWYQGFDPTNQSMTGLAIGTLAMGVLGAMAATGEYASGTIRSTLAATPLRPLVLLAKVAIVGAVTLVVGEVVTFGCWGIGHIVLATGGAPTSSLGQAAVFRAVALSGVFLALLALTGLGLGVILRHTAGAISAFVAGTFLIPILLSRLSSHPDRFTPVVMLANSVSAVVPHQHSVSVPESMLLMACYCVGVLGLAGALLVRRDA